LRPRIAASFSSTPSNAGSASRLARKASVERLQREVPPEIIGAGEETGEALVELLEQLTRPEGKTFWSQGPRLADQLESLFRAIDNAFAAPTAAHEEFLEEMEAACDETFAAINAFFVETVPSLNTGLAEQRLPGLSVPEALDWAEPESDRRW